MNSTSKLVLVALMLIPLSASAMSFQGNQTVIVEQGKTVSGMYFAAGNTVDLAGTFESDVMVAGNEIRISGSVAGDLHVAGNNVTITGPIQGSIRAAGASVQIGNTVGRNVILMGSTVSTTEKSDIAGELLVLGSTARIAGHVGKGVEGWVDVALINGTIDGPVSIRLAASNQAKESPLVLGPNAKINGDLTYASHQDVEKREGATVAGTTTKRVPRGDDQATGLLAKLWVISRFWGLFSLLVVAVLVALLVPRLLREGASLMIQRTGATIGWGALILFATPVIILLLPITVIGIPLALITLGLYLIAWYVSQVFLGYFVGERLLRRLRRAPEAKPLAAVWPTIAGVIVVSLVVDFLLSAVANQLKVGLLFFIIKLFLLVWSFGAMAIVKMRAIREREG